MKPVPFKKVCRELHLEPKDLAGVLGVLDLDAIRLWSTGGVPVPSPIVHRMQRLRYDWQRANKVAQRVIDAKIKPQNAGCGQTPNKGPDEDPKSVEPPKPVWLTAYDNQSIARLKADDPTITLSMHNLVNRATIMKLAELDIPVRLTVIGENAYAAWLGDQPDSKDSRTRYARDIAKTYELGLPLSASPLGQAVLRMKDIPATLALQASRQ